MPKDESKSAAQIPLPPPGGVESAPSGSPDLANPKNQNDLPASGDVDQSERRWDQYEIFLPVSGFVWLSQEERTVVNHPAFQRLGRIYQLGQAYLVFRGATHKRLEHVIGAVHVVQRMIDAVQSNSQKTKEKQRWAPTLAVSEIAFVRLGALLHDIGHIAAGHTIEDELQLVGKHDGDKRLDIVFQSPDWKDRDGYTLGELIDRIYDSFVPEELRRTGITSSKIVRLLIRKEPRKDEVDPHCDALEALTGSSAIRLQICHDMIGNTICADLLDYIHRDWYHVGKPRPFDDRLLQYMEVRRDPAANGLPGPKSSDKFVISLGRRPKIRTDAVSNILDLLEWRYSLAETVLFHRTKLAAASMLDRALAELWGEESENNIVQFFLPLSDEEMLSKCRERADKTVESRKPGAENAERAASASHLLRALERRELFQPLTTRFAGDIPGDLVRTIKTIYALDQKDPKAAARNRSSVLRTLELDFGLPRGSLAMYCPTAMNRKIAEVQIAVGDEIEKFCDYESNHDRPLAGGHLDAQLRRFDRLWGVHFFIDRRVKAEIGERLFLLQQAIDKLALGNLFDDETAEGISAAIARQLPGIDGSPWKGYRYSRTRLAAKADSSVAPADYPTSAKHSGFPLPVTNEFEKHRELLRTSAADLLGSLRCPIRLRSICRKLGVHGVRRERLTGAKSLLVDAGVKPTIILNASVPGSGMTNEQFTAVERHLIAHELGHLVLHQHGAKNPSGRAEYWKLEQLCDEFARHLLIPESIIGADLSSTSATAIARLLAAFRVASICSVPWSVAALRVSETVHDTAFFRLLPIPKGGLKVVVSTRPNQQGIGQQIRPGAALHDALCEKLGSQRRCQMISAQVFSGIGGLSKVHSGAVRAGRDGYRLAVMPE